jgi:succinate-semialdehyde dehydrogenase/glutarate-semialdehyde dehydrogenase
VLVGGEPRHGAGSFYPPTVLADCRPDMLVMREETFGSVAPVRVVPDFDTALAEAADDGSGLAATVLTSRHGARPGGVADAARWHCEDQRSVRRGAGGLRTPTGQRSGFGFGPELLDEMTAVKVVHWSPPGG